MLSAVAFRRATQADRGPVLAINDNIYEGWDYLPDYYDYFEECPNCFHFVAEYSGSVIGYVCFVLVDGMETTISRAGRVSSVYSGQGIYRSLMHYGTGEIQKLHPVLREALATTEQNIKVQNKSSPNPYRLILRRNSHRFILKPELFDKANPLLQTISPRRLDNNMIEALMRNNDLCADLFPDNRIVVDWVPYRVTSSNISPMMEQGRVFYCDGIGEVDKQSRESVLFSIGTNFKPRLQNNAYSIDVYGARVKNLEKHLAVHLKTIADSSSEEINVILFTPSVISNEQLDKAFKTFGLQRSDWISSNQIIYEKQFPANMI